jgi:hypothetical protein
MGDPQTWNGYSYVANNPLSYTDPSGLGFWSTLKSILIDLGLMAGSDVAEAWSGSSSNVQVSGDAGDATVNYGYGGADSFNWANPNYSLSVNSGANDYSGYLPLDLSYSGLSSSSSSPAGGTTKPAPSNGTPQASHSCLAQRVSNAIPGSQLTGGETAQGGHEQFNIATTPAQLSAAGFAPFKVLGIFSNGYRNGALFLQVHVNGQGGAELDGGSSGVLNVQGHFDVFNPAAGYGVGLLLHGIYDLGVGSLFFKHSAGLDPGC